MNVTYSDLEIEAEEAIRQRSGGLLKYKSRDAIGEAIAVVFFASIFLLVFTTFVGVNVSAIETKIVIFSLLSAVAWFLYVVHMQKKCVTAIREEMARLEKVNK